MGPSWTVTTLQKSYFESSIAGRRSDILYIQARSQDFFVGEGGGSAYLKNRDPIFNVWMIRCASSENTQGRGDELTE